MQKKMKGLNVNYRMFKDLWNRQGLTTDRLLSFMKKAKKNRQQNITTNGWQAHIMTDKEELKMQTKDEILRSKLQEDTCRTTIATCNAKPYLNISLDEKCSKNTTLISSAFNMLIG